MEIISAFVDFVLHLDTHLAELVSQYGLLTYGILFFIIFAETGFVVTPFLPGDSLLFAAGALAAIDSLNVGVIILFLIIAAVFGDAINYWIGHFFGRKIVNNPKFPLINQEHIDKTEQFYKKHGGKTIILARFVPFIRTFAPFVAGVGTMKYRRFIAFNIIGAILWINIFTLAGFFFGNIPFVKENFHFAIFVIILLSLTPIIYEYLQTKRRPDVSGVAKEKLGEIVNK